MKRSRSPVPASDGDQQSLTCAVCKQHTARYQCPRCLAFTCSVDCVRKHKKNGNEVVCDGKRDKTAYIAKSEFDEYSMKSDVSLLQDAARYTRTIPALKEARASARSFLGKALAERSIEVLFMPEQFTKRKQNQTSLDRLAGKIRWTVAFRGFPLMHRVDEDLSIKDFIPDEAKDCAILLKVHGCPANAPRYYRMNLDIGVSANLRNTTVVEYPEFIAVASGELGRYAIQEAQKPAEST